MCNRTPSRFRAAPGAGPPARRLGIGTALLLGTALGILLTVPAPAGATAGAVWAWGHNQYAQLGDGTTINRWSPVQSVGMSGVTAMAAGAWHTVALKADGSVWTYGINYLGQLGDGSYNQRSIAAQVAGLTGVTAVAAGDNHCLAVQSSGTLWSWGDNGSGQLGDGTYTQRLVPVQVSSLSGVVAAAGGNAHSLALRSDGTVWAWGNNGSSQLGNNGPNWQPTPVQVNSLSGVVAVAAGSQHSLALRSDGTVWAWGLNYSGQLGDGTTTNRSTPTQVSGLSGVVAITGGGAHSVALRSDGTVWAWGANEAGELGDGTTTYRSLPVQVVGLSNVALIAAGGPHTLAATRDGKVWAWGYNADGEIGDGTTTNRLAPVAVRVAMGGIALAAGAFHSLAAVAPDITPPTTTGWASGFMGWNGWYRSGVQVTLSATDSGTNGGPASGVLGSYFNVDYMGYWDPYDNWFYYYWGVYSQPFTVSGDGSHTVQFYSYDRAYNTEPTRYLSFGIDTSPPVVAPADNSDLLNWYRTDQTASFTASDGTSGLYSSADAAFSLTASAESTKNGGTIQPTVASRTVYDKAGNFTTRSLTRYIDKTPPVISQGPIVGTRGALDGSRQWYLTDVTVNYSAQDALSGLAASSDQAFGLSAIGEGVAVTTLSHTVADVAGNTRTAGPLSFAIDKGDPTVTPGDTVDLAHWCKDPVSVTFAASDAVSGLANPSQDASFTLTASQESPNPGTPTTVSRDVRDKAGRATTRRVSVLLDRTAPVISQQGSPSGLLGRLDGGTQWYRSDVTVDYTAWDALSGLASQNDSYFWLTTSGEGAAVSLPARSVADKAGNTASPATLAFAVDKTPPSVSASLRPADMNGWYNHPVQVTFSASDATSGFLSVYSPITYSGPDSPSGMITGQAMDRAGNVGGTTVTIRYDATAPTVTVAGAHEGDHVRGATITVGVQENLSGLASVTAYLSDPAGKGASYSYPQDSLHFHQIAVPVIGSPLTLDPAHGYGTDGNYTLAVTAADAAGNTATQAVRFTIDSTAPVIAFVDPTPAPGSFHADTQTVAYGLADALDPAPTWLARQLITSSNAGDPVTDPFLNLTAVSGEGRHLVSLSAQDWAGNVGSASRSFTLDRTAPVSATNIAGQPAPTAGWYESLSELSIAATDPPVQNAGVGAEPAGYPGSGVAGISYRVNDGGLVQQPGAFYAFDLSAIPEGQYTIAVHATDNVGNAEADHTATVRLDHTPPTLTGVPADQVLEAVSANGAPFTFDIQAQDNVLLASFSVGHQSGDVFPLDQTTSVTATATDAAGHVTQQSFAVTVRDTTPPAIAGVPANASAEATGAGGAAVSFVMPTATDVVDGPVTVTADHQPGDVFPLGDTTVTFTAADRHGNAVVAHFTVTVKDTTPPTIDARADVTAEATGPTGAAVSFDAPTAHDLVDGAVAVTCAPKSGATFPLGETVVTGTATDAHGNQATRSFKVIVKDTTPPTIEDVPSDITLEAVGPRGIAVTFPAPKATDLVSGNVVVACAPPPGATFPLGTTVVICTATDGAGNATTKTFRITVRDTTPPAITCPADMTVEATGPSGADVTYQVSASDLVDGSVTVVCQPPSGSRLALGDTVVQCSATDAHGNAATASFTITVVDTTPPAITGVPADITAEATGPGGATVTFSSPTATDLVDGPVAVTADHKSGDTFPLGDTKVTFTATDAHGNTATASMVITVKDTTAPAITVPADICAVATSTSGAAVTFAVSATDLVDGSVPVNCSPSSGSTFPLGGPTTVACTAVDKSGNSATASFRVTVAYAGSFFLPPINQDGSSVFKMGSTVPVKFQLTGASAGISNAAASFSYRLVQSSTGAVNESADYTTPSTQFRYDATAGQYILNWGTKGLATGTYELKIDLGDKNPHTIKIGLR